MKKNQSIICLFDQTWQFHGMEPGGMSNLLNKMDQDFLDLQYNTFRTNPNES